ncbi:reverse transcriptase [Corchorus capsularis]|uniref:Reverse transcriptase n=1 Tax=Corchorus capsularis TaxID=210143 RepID=A0A1R3J5H7_COCAP|nr:reverse transcriptase [Corchorus capsularis]
MEDTDMGGNIWECWDSEKEGSKWPQLKVSKEEHESLCQPWKQTLIVKVLVRVRNPDDYNTIVSGGPWIVAGHYLTMRKWKPLFRPCQASITSTAVWVRFPGLPIEFFNRAKLTEAGNLLGRTIKVDKPTDSSSRGKYARVCVEVELGKPLIGGIMVGTFWQKVEYEGLDEICFDCGIYGHKTSECHQRIFKANNETTPPHESDVAVVENQGHNQEDPHQKPQFGPWMLVQKRNKKSPNKGVASSSRIGTTGEGSRFAPLETLGEEDAGNSGKTPVDKPSVNNITPDNNKFSIGNQQANPTIYKKTTRVKSRSVVPTPTNLDLSKVPVPPAFSNIPYPSSTLSPSSSTVNPSSVPSPPTLESNPPKVNTNEPADSDQIQVDTSTVANMDWSDPGEPRTDPSPSDCRRDCDEDGTESQRPTGSCGDLDFSPASMVKESGFQVNIRRKEGNLRLTTVYGSPTPSNREQLWDTLKELGESSNDSWVVGGDFNEIAAASEKYNFKDSDCQSQTLRFENAWMTDPDFKTILKQSWENHDAPIQSKLTKFAEVVRKWNKSSFGNIFQKKKRLLASLRGIQKARCNGENPFLVALEKELQHEYSEVLRQEELLWFQKVRTKWIQSGDRNTTYFHTLALVKRSRNRIRSLKDSEGNWVNDQATIKRMAVQHYKTLYTESLEESLRPDISVTFPRLEVNEIEELHKPVDDDEVKEAMFSIGPHKTPGPDGFQACFFQQNWDTVGEAVTKSVKEAFSSGEHPSKTCHELHPNDFISDFVEWRSYRGIQANKGITTGRSLSPYLFVLGMERLSHIIQHKIAMKQWKPVKISKNGPPISHLFFADDLVLFSAATPCQTKIVMVALKEFNLWTGQSVSLAKSKLCATKNTRKMDAKNLSNQTGIPLTSDLGKYLGVPLIQGRVSKKTYWHTVERVQEKFASWKINHLSLAGRTVLIKSAASPVPIYTMQTARLPLSVCDEIDKRSRGFLWGSSAEKRKIHLVNWEQVCKPKNQEGLDSELQEMSTWLYLQRWDGDSWKKMNKLWARVMTSKYLRKKEFLKVENKNGGSFGWRSILAGRETLLKGLKWRVGNGNLINFLHDKWVSDNKLIDTVVGLIGNWPWSLIFAVTAWRIWKWRNEGCFANKSYTVSTKLAIIGKILKEATDFSNRKMGQHMRREVLIGWEKPKEGQVKINTDGSWFQRTNEAAVGGVVRGSCGEWLLGFSQSVGECSIDLEELWDILQGLSLAWSRGFNDIVVESDSATSVDMIKKGVNKNHPHFCIIAAIQDYLSKEWTCQLHYIPRENNFVADWMAKNSSGRHEGIMIYNTPPAGVLNLLIADAVGVAFPRMVT